MDAYGYDYGAGAMTQIRAENWFASNGWKVFPFQTSAWKHYNEGFNGIVRFNYLPERNPEPEVRSKLDMMEQRFNYWAQTFEIFASDQTTPCKLITNKSS